MDITKQQRDECTEGTAHLVGTYQAQLRGVERQIIEAKFGDDYAYTNGKMDRLREQQRYLVRKIERLQGIVDRRHCGAGGA